MAEPGARGFWTSLPGVLTASAAVITALTGAWIAISHGRQGGTPSVPAVEASPVGISSGVKSRAAADALPATNLMAADNGGTLVFSSSSSWDKMINGDDDRGAQIGEHGGDFGIFAFRDRRAASIGAFTVMVPEASSYNPAAIELSYAVRSEDGPFVPIRTIDIRDGRVAPDGRQVFRFDPVVARYLKVKLRKSQSGSPYIMAYEFGALGMLADR